MQAKEYSQALSEAEEDIKSHWQQVLDGVEAKGSVAYIWEILKTGDNHLFFIKRAIGTVESIEK